MSSSRNLSIALGAVVLVLVVTTLFLYQRYQKSSADFVAMTNEEQAMRNRYGQAINEIASIQDSLNAIVLGDEATKLKPAELQSEQNISGRSDEALERIAVLKAGIERTKERIQELDAQLKQSGVKVAGLQKMITNLKKSVEEKEQLVADLTAQVEQLNTRVTGLTEEVEQKQVVIAEQASTIEDRQRELGTIYYAIGSKKDLTSAGLVVAKGGVLGMGKTLEASGKVTDGAFQPLNTDQETVIRIASAKAQVLSDQPASSYELQPVGKELELRILDPKQFRTVKHLVIVTT
jgi:chromosome segregation ATPase